MPTLRTNQNNTPRKRRTEQMTLDHSRPRSCSTTPPTKNLCRIRSYCCWFLELFPSPLLPQPPPLCSGGNDVGCENRNRPGLGVRCVHRRKTIPKNHPSCYGTSNCGMMRCATAPKLGSPRSCYDGGDDGDVSDLRTAGFLPPSCGTTETTVQMVVVAAASAGRAVRRDGYPCW